MKEILSKTTTNLRRKKGTGKGRFISKGTFACYDKNQKIYILIYFLKKFKIVCVLLYSICQFKQNTIYFIVLLNRYSLSC